MQDICLDVQAVKYRYDEDSPEVLHGVSVQIEKGSFTAVLGHNGSGKSTLAKLLNGLFLPTEGKVLVCGMDTADEALTWDIRSRAGMVFQNPDNQIVATVVREDVAFGLENTGVPTAEMPARIDAALQGVGMTAFAERAPHTLSGGQKQRVAIAGILAMQPEALIMDEATAMLDPQGRKEVFDTVRKLNRENGITVVWITHFMEEAAKCDRVIVIHDGSVRMDGTPREVFSHVDEMRDMRLDVPPMTALAHRLHDDGLPVRTDLLTEEELAEEVARALCPSK